MNKENFDIEKEIAIIQNRLSKMERRNDAEGVMDIKRYNMLIDRLENIEQKLRLILDIKKL